MKVGILYFGVGRYSIFWKKFYKSAEQFLLNDCEKEYYVFTDSENILQEAHNKNVYVYAQESLGWPNMSLMRFEIFFRAYDRLQNVDYIVFFNANIEIKRNIYANDFLPILPEDNLLVCLHPYYYNKPIDEFPYDRNNNNRACIPKGKGRYYVQGALQGGRTKFFLEAIAILKDWVNEDLKKGVVPVWHDESYWNKYILDRTDLKVLSPSYLYPEGKHLPFEKKIEIVDKGRHFGFDYLRGYRDTPESDLKLFFKDNVRKFKKLILKKV
ncbi:MAG: family 6 glucosyltransferase [Bacteroidales bacterium]